MKKYYYIHTFGCKVNQYESQLISEKFENDGFERTEVINNANIVIINSCTVTKKADKKCINFLKKIINLQIKQKIILTGCLAKNKTFDISNISTNIEVIKNKSMLFNKKKQIISSFYKHSRAFLKIQDGCCNFCSYCIIPYIRNVSWSKEENEVILEIVKLIKLGYLEIVLTGINIGKYQGGFSSLIEKIVKIPFNFRIRISSIELTEIDDKLIDIIKSNTNKICNHLHIPLQSGSDEILKSMNRKYSIKIFEKKINKIINSLQDITLTTDIITGFPGETYKNHKETCSFVKLIPFSKIHIFRYSDREYTKASNLIHKIHEKEIKNRSNDLFKINLIKKNIFIKENIGKIKKAIKLKSNEALTDNYIKTKIDNKKKYDNCFFEIKITENSKI